MSKVKKKEISHYETLFIISNKFAEDELEPVLDKVKKIITDQGGVITYNEVWGKKKMAYPINGFWHGYYFLYEFDAPGENLAKIERSLRLSSEVIRHQTIAKRVKSEAEIEKDKKIAEKIAAKNVEKAEREEKEREEEVKKEKDKKKVDLKELDEKLDKILEADDLL